MSLTPGTRLGPYSVTAKIGEGGMGKVYRARDTKLDRDVALKVLPQAFTDVRIVSPAGAKGRKRHAEQPNHVSGRLGRR